jgi:hypothetical protein
MVDGALSQAAANFARFSAAGMVASAIDGFREFVWRYVPPSTYHIILAFYENPHSILNGLGICCVQATYYIGCGSWSQ